MLTGACAGGIRPDITGSQGSLGGAAGTSHGHHKAPFSSGTRPRGEPPSGRGTRLPHSRPYQWQAVHDVGPIVLLCGLIEGAGQGQAEEGGRSCAPQEKGALEPHEDRQGIPSRARDSEDHGGQATAVTEGWGLQGEDGGAAPLQALLKGPGRAPPNVSVQPWRKGESGRLGSR